MGRLFRDLGVGDLAGGAAMSLYARAVLWLIQPAMDLAYRRWAEQKKRELRDMALAQEALRIAAADPSPLTVWLFVTVMQTLAEGRE